MLNLFMLLYLSNLLIGFCLILISLAILLNYVRTKRINIFFFLLILFAGFARFQYGLVSLEILQDSKPVVLRVFILLFAFPPLYLFCLKTFIGVKTTYTKTLLHFSFFLLIVGYRFYIGAIEIKLLGLIFFVYTCFYYYLLINSAIKYLRAHHSIYTQQQLIKVKQLTIWILALSINNFIFTIYFIFFNSSSKQEVIHNMFNSTVIVWILFVSYLFFNPGIVFNEVFKKKDLNRNFSKDFNIWNHKALLKIEPQDSALDTIIRKNSTQLLEDLQQLKPELIISANSTKLIAEIAKHLNYPKSHLKFAIKYHCRFSQSDYLNLMRLIHALTLINNGYLENYTIETLGEQCHFNSRTSFYRHFKRHMGVSPSQYKTLIE
jgi:AraC-like DNA-binding protein